MTGALSYDASALPPTMRLVSAPSGSVASGSVAATPFAVQVLAGDGVTPAAGEAVLLSVAAGSAQLGCGASTCSMTTDARGMATTTVLPLAAGAVTLQAVDGAMSQAASFTALAQVGSVQILNAPSGSVAVQAGSQWMSAQALMPGGAGASGVPMSFSAIPAGAVRFGACAATACTVATNGGGVAATGLTPLIAGPVQLVVTAGSATATASFTAVANANVLVMTTAPSGTSYVGSPTPAALSARLFASDGVTPLFGRTLVFSAPAGVLLDACGASTCTLSTTFSTVGTAVIPQIAGTFTVQVTDGVSVQTATFTAVPRTPQLKVLSAPADGSSIGMVAATPFKAQLLDGRGLPWPSVSVTLVPQQLGAALMLGCGAQSSCTFTTDANGMVSTTVQPLVAGVVSLQAVCGPLVQTVSFLASAGQASVTPVQPALYVAEQATVVWTPAAVATLNGVAAVDQVVTWTGSSGFAAGAYQTATDATGATQAASVVGGRRGQCDGMRLGLGVRGVSGGWRRSGRAAGAGGEWNRRGLRRCAFAGRAAGDRHGRARRRGCFGNGVPDGERGCGVSFARTLPGGAGGGLGHVYGGVRCGGTRACAAGGLGGWRGCDAPCGLGRDAGICGVGSGDHALRAQGAHGTSLKFTPAHPTNLSS